MDPDAIIKAAPELIKHGAEVVAALKLTDLAKAILGPATGEFAERIHDGVRLYRFGRQLKCLQKAEKMAKDAGFTPKAVPIKLLFPLLEGASFEEDENLHTMWAALLANAASPENAGRIRPGFIAILKQMDPHEAALLNTFYEELQAEVEVTAENEFRKSGLDDWTLSKQLRSLTSLDAKVAALIEKTLSLEGLTAQLLIEKTFWRKDAENVFTEVEPAEGLESTFTLTFRGRAFIEACRPPVPKPK